MGDEAGKAAGMGVRVGQHGTKAAEAGKQGRGGQRGWRRLDGKPTPDHAGAEHMNAPAPS
ncbi:hypothetical protein [Hyphomonas sp.]|uniref:hypothetical protein n=1 Tax=Hyphomonas sp. TaxID=87 RepID=UPI003F6E642E